MPTASGVNRPRWAISLSATVIRRLCGPFGMAAFRRIPRSVSRPEPSVSQEKKWPMRTAPAPISVIRLRVISMSEQPTPTSTP